MANNFPEGIFEIKNGPSKFDFMLSAFDGKKVEFSCEIEPQTGEIKMYPRIKATIAFAGAEDGSYDSWIGEVNFCDPNYPQCKRTFYYSSKTRTGTIGVEGKKFV